MQRYEKIITNKIIHEEIVYYFVLFELNKTMEIAKEVTAEVRTYNYILRIVEEITGITSSEILTSNREERVDARYIFVNILSERGYSDSKISQLTTLTRPCICMLRNKFQYRRKRYFVELNYNKVKERVFSNNKVIK